MIRLAVGLGLVSVGAVVTHGLVTLWTWAASDRLAELEGQEVAPSPVAVAMAADEEYCTPKLKRVLRRVLTERGRWETPP